MKLSTIVFGLLMFVTGCTSTRTRAIANAQWPAVLTFLQGLTDKCAKEELNVFFVSPVVRMDGARHVYAYWMTDNSIVPMGLPPEQMLDTIGYLSEYAHRIDLSNGVVPAREDVGSSTYLTDSEWVAARLRDCLVSGTKLILHKWRANKSLETNRR